MKFATGCVVVKVSCITWYGAIKVIVGWIDVVAGSVIGFVEDISRPLVKFAVLVDIDCINGELSENAL